MNGNVLLALLLSVLLWLAGVAALLLSALMLLALLLFAFG